MQKIHFDFDEEPVSKQWNLNFMDIDLLIETRKIYVNVSYVNNGLTCTVSITKDKDNPDDVPFDIELSTPWEPPSYIPFVPQTMYDDFVRHQQLFVNIKRNKGIYFTTFEI